MSLPPTSPPPTSPPAPCAATDGDHPPGGYVFVVTYGRSGSTLLQNLLNHLPGYCIRGENNNALFHFARAWGALAHAEAIQPQRRKGIKTPPHHPWYGTEAVDPDRLGADLAALFARDVLRPPAGTRVAGFKEIRWHAQPQVFNRTLDFARRFFPGARFIFNTRPHDQVARSGWWATQDPGKVRDQLARIETLYTRYQARAPKACLALDYGDYDGRPEGFRPLFEFLGEPWDADLVENVLGQKLQHLKTPKAI